jgi:hypothetical protein
MKTNKVNRRKVSSKIDEQQAAGGIKTQELLSTKTRLLNGMTILAFFEREYEFGQQITHVSHAPRLQHRGNELNILVASWTIFVPIIECSLDE